MLASKLAFEVEDHYKAFIHHKAKRLLMARVERVAGGPRQYYDWNEW